MKKLGIIGTALLVSSSLYAGNLSTPIAYDNAKVLPKGVRNVRYNNVFAEANDKFGTNGSSVGVGNAFNVPVSYAKQIESKDTALERGILEGYLKRHNKDLSSISGTTTGVVNVEVDAKVPIIAMGITRKWTMAIVVPVVKTSTNIDTGFIASADFQDVANTLIAEGKQFKADEAQQKSNSAIADEVVKYGYKPLANEKKNMLGDIRLVNKIQLTNKETHAIAITTGLVLPTGEQADINKVVDPAAGDGQVDYELGLNGEYYPTSKLSISARVSYTLQAKDTKAKRVPEVMDSTLTPDIDPQVNRDLGDTLFTSVGSAYQFDMGLVVKAQYSFQYKEADVYTGSKYSSERYAWMGKDTRQNLQALQLGLGYSTLPAFKRKQFPVPLEFNMSYGRPLAGKNVTKDSSVVAEMAMYF